MEPVGRPGFGHNDRPEAGSVGLAPTPQRRLEAPPGCGRLMPTWGLTPQRGLTPRGGGLTPPLTMGGPGLPLLSIEGGGLTPPLTMGGSGLPSPFIEGGGLTPPPTTGGSGFPSPFIEGGGLMPPLLSIAFHCLSDARRRRHRRSALQVNAGAGISVEAQTKHCRQHLNNQGNLCELSAASFTARPRCSEGCPGGPPADHERQRTNPDERSPSHAVSNGEARPYKAQDMGGLIGPR